MNDSVWLLLERPEAVNGKAELSYVSTGGSALRNTFAGIDQSLDGAVGVTALVLKGEPQRLSFDSGFGYIGEGRRVGAVAISGRSTPEFGTSGSSQSATRSPTTRRSRPTSIAQVTGVSHTSRPCRPASTRCSR